VLRHGQSTANQQALIVSAPETGVEQFGLTELGRDQVRTAVLANRQALESCASIYASDFLRTRQTAEIASEILNVPIQFTPALRERCFGKWEGSSNENYEHVWQADAIDARHQTWQVESVESVAQRTTALLTQITSASHGQCYLLVSHGDPLQILMTSIAGHDLRSHRRRPPLQTAELRPLIPPPS
jgi:probable phosphoglycerate mutase